MNATLAAQPRHLTVAGKDAHNFLLDENLPGTSVTWEQVLTETPEAALYQQVSYAQPFQVLRNMSHVRETPYAFTSLDEAATLKKKMASAARGEALILQAGQCVESMENPEDMEAFVSMLKDLGNVMTKETGLPIVHIGRVAGQLTKPRTSSHEDVDGKKVLTYRGPMIHGYDPNNREPNADLIQEAYDFSRVRADQLVRKNIKHAVKVYASHEALSLPYEHAMLRSHSQAGEDKDITLAGSAPYIWIGDRTRQLDGPHVALAAQVVNPVGVKCNASMKAEELEELIQKINPNKELGKLTLVFRMGADKIDDNLPGLLDTVAKYKDSVVVMCDPMHGNTKDSMPMLDEETGQLIKKKTRYVQDIHYETARFVEICSKKGIHAAGIHIESSVENVTECLGDNVHSLLPNYQTLCDPGLNPVQARGVAKIFGQTRRLTPMAP